MLLKTKPVHDKSKPLRDTAFPIVIIIIIIILLFFLDIFLCITVKEITSQAD